MESGLSVTCESNLGRFESVSGNAVLPGADYFAAIIVLRTNGLSARSLRPHRDRSRHGADRRRWRNDRDTCNSGYAFDGGRWGVSFRRERTVIARVKPLSEIAVSPPHARERRYDVPDVLDD